MPTSKQMSDYMVEPVLVGAGLGAGAAWWWGTDAAVKVMGKGVDLWILVAGLGVVSSIGMNYIENMINTNLPDKYSIVTHPLETAVNIAGTTGILLATESIIAPGVASESFMPMLGIATGSKIGARYIAHEYIMPWLGKGTSDY